MMFETINQSVKEKTYYSLCINPIQFVANREPKLIPNYSEKSQLENIFSRAVDMDHMFATMVSRRLIFELSAYLKYRVTYEFENVKGTLLCFQKFLFCTLRYAMIILPNKLLPFATPKIYNLHICCPSIQIPTRRKPNQSVLQ